MPVSGRTRWMLAAGGAVAGVTAVTGAVAAVAAMTAPPSLSAAAAPLAPASDESTKAAQIEKAQNVKAQIAKAQKAKAQNADRATARPLGEVIRSGMRARQGEWVFYALKVSNAQLPGTTFGVMAARRLPTGQIIDMVTVNETEGSDRSPGFHSVEGAMEVAGEPTPAFGYYAGPAARITATVRGRTVTARQATWSKDRSIVIFWFTLKDVHATKGAGGASGIPADLRAFDRSGRALPIGDATVAVG